MRLPRPQTAFWIFVCENSCKIRREDPFLNYLRAQSWLTFICAKLPENWLPVFSPKSHLSTWLGLATSLPSEGRRPLPTNIFIKIPWFWATYFDVILNVNNLSWGHFKPEYQLRASRNVVETFSIYGHFNISDAWKETRSPPEIGVALPTGQAHSDFQACAGFCTSEGQATFRKK